MLPDVNPCLRAVFLVSLVTTAAFGQGEGDELDAGKSGVMALSELRSQPLTLKLDVPYTDTGNPAHRLDVYLPAEKASDRLPVIVFFHGGGWRQGDKADGAARLLPFVSSGRYAGVAVNYRLSGEARWPAQLSDVKAAIRWVRANAERYSFDADHIAVFGRGAGGHLALMVGVTGDVPKLEGNLGPNRSTSSQVAAVVNFFGATDLRALVGQATAIDRSAAGAPEALLLGGPLPANLDKAEAASPLTYVSAGDAPTLTVHGMNDRIVPYDQAVTLDQALRQAGVASVLLSVKGGGAGDFDPVADDRVQKFLEQYLQGGEAAVSSETLTWRARR